jgi:transcriptional regulator with XRE-family HTH domain
MAISHRLFPTVYIYGKAARSIERSNRNDVARNIRRLREAREESQVVFARRAGLNRTRLSALEKGERQNATVKTLERLAAGLDVDIRELLHPD